MKIFKNKLFALVVAVLAICTLFSLNVFASDGDFVTLDNEQTVYVSQNTEITDEAGNSVGILPKGSKDENTAVMIGYKGDMVYIQYNNTLGYIPVDSITVVADNDAVIVTTTKADITDIIVSIGQENFGDEIPQIREDVETVSVTGRNLLNAFDNILSMVRDFFSKLLNFLLEPLSEGKLFA